MHTHTHNRTWWRGVDAGILGLELVQEKGRMAKLEAVEF